MDHGARAWQRLQAIRHEAPLIHAITNQVAMDMVANALLALGASPVMAIAEEEVEEVVQAARALVINLGTLTPPGLAAMRLAARKARALGRPWVLDPVGAGGASYRTAAARELLALGPTVVRANASEILALAGAPALTTTKGVDSRHGSEEATEAAALLADRTGAVVAVTGRIDRLTDGVRWSTVHNGDPRMTRVSGLGCALSATVGAFLAVEPDPMLAATQAVAVFGLAGERAAAGAAGPGSLRQRIVDQLALLDQATLREEARIA